MSGLVTHESPANSLSRRERETFSSSMVKNTQAQRVQEYKKKEQDYGYSYTHFTFLELCRILIKSLLPLLP